jgi:hypothetical protein
MADTTWEECRTKVFQRDRLQCRLFKTLSVIEAMLLKKNAGSQFGIIDTAHIFPRSTHLWIKNDPDNVVCLNRYSHQMLENCCHPITGKPISKDEEIDWWKKVLGDVRFNLLVEKALHRPLGGYITKEETDE